MLSNAKDDVDELVHREEVIGNVCFSRTFVRYSLFA